MKTASSPGRIPCAFPAFPPPTRARTAIEADIAANGAYWGVVLNAGVTCDNAFPALEEEDWKRVIDVGMNANDFLYASIHEVLKTLIEAFILVFIVVYILSLIHI